MKKLQLLIVSAAAALLLSMNAFAVVGTVEGDPSSDSDDILIDVEQYVSLTAGVQRAAGVVDVVSKSNTASTSTGVDWVVYSNNAVTIAFTGTSKQDDGTLADNAYPLFTKADILVDGSVSANNYDNLATTFNATVTSHGSTSTGVATSGALAPATFVSDAGTTIGRIMPTDAQADMNIGLEAIGTWDSADQSGNYWAEVTLTVTADEQEDLTSNPATK